jgi:hypothetical protein
MLPGSNAVAMEERLGKGTKLQSGEYALPNGCEASDKAEVWAAAMLQKG